jgi:pimeloyl-ACP methyl ester carboxylesterase
MSLPIVPGAVATASNGRATDTHRPVATHYRDTVATDPTTPIELSSLPPAVQAALVDPRPESGWRSTTVANGIPYSALEWGDPSGRPLVLVHGLGSSARNWWRVGPALAAADWRVIAPDQAGHGHTGHWAGHHRFRDNARDLAAWIRAARLDVPDLQVVGHSWGGMTVAALPIAGIRPATLVLLDPPTLPRVAMAVVLEDPGERPREDVGATIAFLTPRNPAWSAGDIEAKAQALHEVDLAAARDILLENGDWDGGFGDIADPAAAGLDIWLIRGDPAVGGLVSDPSAAAFAARLGSDHVLKIPGGHHSPMRSHPIETTAALLTALVG